MDQGRRFILCVQLPSKVALGLQSRVRIDAQYHDDGLWFSLPLLDAPPFAKEHSVHSFNYWSRRHRSQVDVAIRSTGLFGDRVQNAIGAVWDEKRSHTSILVSGMKDASCITTQGRSGSCSVLELKMLAESMFWKCTPEGLSFLGMAMRINLSYNQLHMFLCWIESNYSPFII